MGNQRNKSANPSASASQHGSIERSIPVITHIITMGDSLSDRGTMDKRKLLGIIPMSKLSGLTGFSPDGRFTNGLAWDDHLSASLANEFNIRKFERKDHLRPTDIADAVIAHDPRVEKRVENSYELNDDLAIQYRGRNFVRTYNEGGLSAHDYGWWPSTSIKRFFSRLILSTLEQKREELLADDRGFNITMEDKAQTLVIEWSGANDLITVNAEPSQVEADRAIRDRIENMKKLIRNGYRHFILFELPDLSLTPRYQAQSAAARNNAHDVSIYFNRRLQEAVRKLQAEFPSCTMNVYEVNRQFSDMYNNPEKYQLDPAKRTQPYTTSRDFRINPDGTSPAEGYMFWDDVHPTANVHARLADNFMSQYQRRYQFRAPAVKTEMELCMDFRKKYRERLSKDRNSFFGRFTRSSMNVDKLLREANPLAQILKHALVEGGSRTREVIMELGWLSKQGKVNEMIPAIREAKAILDGKPVRDTRPKVRMTV